MIPPGYSDVSRVLAFESATDIDVTSLLSKLTPTVKGALRAERRKEKIETTFTFYFLLRTRFNAQIYTYNKL